MGIQDNIYPDLLSRAERAPTVLTDAELIAAAGTPEEAEHWTQLANNLKYILISTTSAAAATVCRQHQAAMGLEVYRQLCQRFSIPLGTRSSGYLTKLLKPTFNHNNFEESFSTWEFEVDRYERDNNTQLPDKVKISVLMNETTGLCNSITPERRTSTNIPNDQRDHYRVLQDNNSLCEASTTSVLISEHQSQWRTGSNGYFSSTQRKRRKRQRTQRIQRKATRQRIQRKRKRIWLSQGLRRGKRKSKR